MLGSLIAAVGRASVGFYFRRIDRVGLEAIPAEGPVLLVANHPNSLADAFVVGAAVPRPVRFVATVQLFRHPVAAWALKACGVIPINRVKDDPSKMRNVASTFQACFEAFDRGEAVCLFPEGITHDDPRLQEVKSGAARLALEAAGRGGSTLRVVPLGLIYSDKSSYRSDALVRAGEPVDPAEFLPEDPAKRRESISRLTETIAARIKALILHVEDPGHAAVLESVRRIYLDRLKLGNLVVSESTPPPAEDLLLSRAIADAVRWAHENESARAASLRSRILRYERRLAALGLDDAAVRGFAEGPARAFSAPKLALGLALLPVAAYGWAHRLVPSLLVAWAVRRFGSEGNLKARVAPAKIVSGLLAFGGFYGVLVFGVHAVVGWPASLWYAASLPVASLAAFEYAREGGRLFSEAGAWLRLTRLRFAAPRLASLRSEIVAEIEALREAYRRGAGARPA